MSFHLSPKLYLLVFLLSATLFDPVWGQKNYWVVFDNKEGVDFSPEREFSPVALQKRARLGIPFSSTDWPVNKDYINQITSLVNKRGVESRWLNALVVRATYSQVKRIQRLAFVKEVVPINSSTEPARAKVLKVQKEDITAQYHLLRQQTERMGGGYFKHAGLTGKGLRIAIFDGGFPAVPTHPAFTHLFANNRIVATWDFTRDKENVYRGNQHGTMVLSCIAGKMGELPIGLATDAEFLLAITEVGSEPFSEESYWMAAMEWADRNGADIINSSLGYTFHRYFPHQMDGSTSLIAQAAKMASEKGILVVNAAGNEGESRWEVIGTPADAPNILSVGGIDPQTGIHFSFSSLGPTADGRPKPNVSAFGKAFVATKHGNYQVAYGTSFASPLVAGFAACVWQKNREWKNIQVLQEIEHSCDLFPYYDYAHGYGVPQARYFTQAPLEEHPTFEIFTSGEFLYIRVTDEVWNRLSGYEKSRIFYNIQASNGKLKSYYVIDVYRQEALRIPLPFLDKDDRLNISYMGHYREVKKSQVTDQNKTEKDQQPIN